MIEIACVCIELECVAAVTTQQFLTPIVGLNEFDLKNKLELFQNKLEDWNLGTRLNKPPSDMAPLINKTIKTGKQQTKATN